MPNAASCLPALLLLYAIWGFNWVVMRAANSYFTPVLFVTIRFALGAAILIAVCAWRGKLIPAREHRPWIALSGLLLAGVSNVAVQISTKWIGGGLSAALYYTMPAWVVLLAAVFLGERVTRRKVFGLACALVGLFVLLGATPQGGVMAMLPALFGAVTWAAASIITKKKLQGCDMLQYTAWQMAAGAALLVAIILVFPQEPPLWRPAAIGAALWNGAVASALAFLLWNRILTRMEAGKASVAIMAVPAVGVLACVLVLDEPMTWAIALGMAALLAGILIVLGVGEPRR